jgi:hypothetical protein
LFITKKIEISQVDFFVYPFYNNQINDKKMRYIMKRLLFFTNIIFVFMHQVNFGMLLYQLEKKKTFFNTFLKQKSPRKQISPKQWFYLQGLFLKRNQILDALRRELKISDPDWLNFHKETLFYLPKIKGGILWPDISKIRKEI